jgi:integrase
MPKPLATTHEMMKRTLVVYRRERSDVWQCRFKVDGVWQRASTKERILEKAKERAKELFVAAEIRKRENLPVVTRKFRHCAELAIQRMKHEKELKQGKVIYDTYIRVLKDYVIPVIGNRNITNITIEDLQELHKRTAKAMDRVPTRSTMTKHNTAINRVFDEAIARNLVTRSQLPELVSKGKEGKTGPSFNLKEVQSLRLNYEAWINRARTEKSRAKRELLCDYVEVLLDTGCRPGKELLDLTWSKINYAIKPVVTNTGVMDGDGTTEEPEEIVTVNLNRSVELRVSGKTGPRTCVGMQRACDALTRIARRLYNVNDNIARPFESLLKANNKNYVFAWKSVDDNGKVTLHRAKGFEHLFVAFLNEHNLLFDPKTEQNRKLYSLRHTYATFALQHDKVPIHTLAKQMGTSVLMIEKHYSDLEPVKAIDQLRGEETRRLIEAGTVVDEAYRSKKTVKK